jgi:hypothetical protein
MDAELNESESPGVYSITSEVGSCHISPTLAERVRRLHAESPAPKTPSTEGEKQLPRS